MFCLILSSFLSSLRSFQTKHTPHACLFWNERKEERWVDKIRQNISNAGLGLALGFFFGAALCRFMFCLLLSTYRSSLSSFQTEHMCSVWNELKDEWSADKSGQNRSLGSPTALWALCFVFLLLFSTLFVSCLLSCSSPCLNVLLAFLFLLCCVGPGPLLQDGEPWTIGFSVCQCLCTAEYTPRRHNWRYCLGLALLLRIVLLRHMFLTLLLDTSSSLHFSLWLPSVFILKGLGKDPYLRQRQQPRHQ